MAQFNFSDIESKWKSEWTSIGLYKTETDNSKPKYYVLDMFPYPSGAGLHVGHPLGYIASDIYARYKVLSGYNVLHPMGFDAFGLPAEQYAIQTGKHPEETTKENIRTYKKQLSNIGLSYDWDREVVTCEPSYYKWTQWIFTKLFNHYYCLKSNSARPITDLIKHFASQGSESSNAYGNLEQSFNAEEWNNFSAKEQSDVLMHFRLAYKKTSYVNWCEALGTVLANDEVVNGVSERGGHPVVQKPMLQWSLRITAYAERLLTGLDNLDWTESIKLQQKNWIGKSEGASVQFEIEGTNGLEIFTTRPDTIFGVTFMVLAPEHPYCQKIVTDEYQEELSHYIERAKSKSSIDRQAGQEVSGVFTGAYATHSLSGKKIPIWVSDYVLIDYGTGAIMAVPSDDERDRAFAEKMNLDIIEICDQSGFPDAKPGDKVGILKQSGFLDGLSVSEAMQRAIAELEERGLGKRQINYKLRDANFSRQRYWGEPFPVYYDEDEVPHILEIEHLPLELPQMDNIEPIGGKAPLNKAKNWDHSGWPLDTDTMPGNAGSSWYFLRYMDPHNEEAFCSPEALNYWQDVDLYIGGTEHAVGHLMYARFWHKFLYDLGYVTTEEPFKKLLNQGMIQGVVELLYMQKEKVDGVHRFLCAGLVGQEPENEFVKLPIHISFVKDYGTDSSYLDIESIKKFIDWRPEYKNSVFECSQGVFQNGVFTAKHSDSKDSELHTHSEIGKMSKRWYNVVNPDDVIAEYGADCFRMFEMFLGPIETAKPWNTKGIDGVAKFLRKFNGLFYKREELNISYEAASEKELKVLHTCIKKVSEDIERFSFNTCVSAFMICVNDLTELNCNKKEVLEPLMVLLAPFAPFITEELWHSIGHDSSVHKATWPTFEEKFLVESSKEYPVSINGKMRTTLTFPLDESRENMEAVILANEIVQKWMEGKPLKKLIIVPGKIINVVV